jgi:hypothetical protein
MFYSVLRTLYLSCCYSNDAAGVCRARGFLDSSHSLVAVSLLRLLFSTRSVLTSTRNTHKWASGEKAVGQASPPEAKHKSIHRVEKVNEPYLQKGAYLS